MNDTCQAKAQWNLKEELDEILSRVKTEKVSTIDLLEQLKHLHSKIEDLTHELFAQLDMVQDLEISNAQMEKQVAVANAQLEDYRQEFVIPAKEYEAKSFELKTANYEWQVQRRYMRNELHVLKEILSTVCAKSEFRHKKNTVYNEVHKGYDSNGTALYATEATPEDTFDKNIHKPNLKTPEPTLKDDE